MQRETGRGFVFLISEAVLCRRLPPFPHADCEPKRKRLTAARSAEGQRKQVPPPPALRPHRTRRFAPPFLQADPGFQRAAAQACEAADGKAGEAFKSKVLSLSRSLSSL